MTAISYITENIDLPPIQETKVSEWIKQIAKSHNRDVGELTYLFCDDDKILEVNNQYLQHDYYTDIITFDYSEGDTISGDIFVSVDTVKSNSEAFGTDYLEELHRVIIHGVLHLCGKDDHSDEEEKQMRAYEDKALEMLKKT